MANTDAVTHDWSTYAEEAAVPDFVLNIKDQEPIRFKNPDGAAVMRIAEGVRSGDLDALLSALAGDNYERMMDLMGNAGHQALPALVEDLMDHFNLYDPVTLRSPNARARRDVTRPTEIKRLLSEGWTPVGGLPASAV